MPLTLPSKTSKQQLQMLSTGIPELQSLSDIDYLRDAFALDLTEAEATAKFRDLIFTSLTTWTTRVNNAVHVALRLCFFFFLSTTSSSALDSCRHQTMSIINKQTD